MPGSALAEIIFIAAMMVLILIISFVAVYYFFKTYRKEMEEKKAREDSRNVGTRTEATVAAKENANGAS
jgi:flagellar biosynthesis/type III secretory pathway M-ring protein FliF/YscJ